jgi:hypothetical protein
MIQTRNRSRPPGSLQERLYTLAEVARKRASEMPAGDARAALLRKAELAERSAAMAAWLSSPGSPLPE